MSKNKDPLHPKPRPPMDPSQRQDRSIAGLYGNSGVNAGNGLIQKFLPDGVLGRVDTNVPGSEEQLARQRALYDKGATRDPAQADVMSRMQAGLGGYTSPEYQAQREQMMKGVDSNYATSAGQLQKAQSRAKVYGAAGAAQMANLQTSTQNSKNDLEQQLYVKNIDEQQNRLKTYGAYGRGLDQEEYARQADATKSYGDTEAGLRGEQLDREKTNLGQSNAEVAARIGLFTGAGASAIQKAQTRAAQQIQREGIDKLSRRG